MTQKFFTKLNPIYTTGIPGIDAQYNEVFLLYDDSSLLNKLEKAFPYYRSQRQGFGGLNH